MKSLPDRLQAENSLLRPFAVPQQGIWGREHDEQPDDTRSPFQRDLDRISKATAFRRLKGKTQVFVTGDGDHYRTRLTHTFEVARVSRSIARTLGLNEDLCECIALTHDLGHPPFGHAGEEAIDAAMRVHGLRFEHNLQSHRIVTLLEQRPRKPYPGLNLNREVLQGMLKHVTPHDHPSHQTSLPEGAGHTLEAQVVNVSDEIAYTSHDCDDGLREGLFSEQDVSATQLGSAALHHSIAGSTDLQGALTHLLVTDLYRESETRLAASDVRTFEDVLRQTTPLIGFSAEMRRQLNELRAFLWKHMYLHPKVASRVDEGKATVLELCERLHARPGQKVLELQQQTRSTLEVAVKDYVAGMTDWFAVETLSALRTAA